MDAPRRRTRRDPRLVALAEESGYEIIERIGAGGMGIVYLARDADGREVAVKLLRHDIADDPRARARLSREVAAQQLVRNENIVRILDAELDSADAFVVTEFVPGPTLEEAVHAHGGLHPEAVREIATTLGEALGAIHAAGVIHRDLKPSNVLLRHARTEDLRDFDPDGDRLDPVIIDFGIAMAAEESRLTSTGLVMGTAAYLDPEVVRTNHTAEAGDWWAWAAMVAFAATGREPYGTGRADLVFLRADRGEIDLDGVPTELGDWLRDALRADPADRAEPRDLLARLADLDLERYPDAGETEVLTADGRTHVLAAGTVGGAGSEDGAVVEDPDATAALDVVPERDRTAALPVTEQGGGDPATEALPAGPPAVDPSWWGTGGADRTEVIPVVGPATAVLPVVPDPVRRSDPPPSTPQPLHRAMPSQAPVRRAPEGYGTPAPYPPSGTAPGVGVPPPPQAVGPSGVPWPPPAVPAPRRHLLVAAGHLLVVGLAAVAPYLAVVLLLLLGALARTWETTHRAVWSRRSRGATGAGPTVTAAVAAPVRFLLGLLVTALQLLFPLVLGLLVGLALDAGLTLGLGTTPPDGLTYATAVGLALLVTWVGLGSRVTRDGAHRAVDAAAPDTTWTIVLGALLGVLLVAVAVTVLARGGSVDLLPFATLPSLLDLAVWRR